MAVVFLDIARFLAGLYSFILIIVGTPLNLLCFYIFTRLVPNRSNATIIVFAHLALIELLIPFTWNMNYVVRELLWKYQKNISMKNLEQHSLFVCKLIAFGAYFSLQCAAWLKTLATFARCVSLHNSWSLKNWLAKPINIRRVIFFVIFIIALLNFPIWIVNGEYGYAINELNQTQAKVRCYQSSFFQFWEVAHLLIYNFIPFTLMIISNILIIQQVRESRNRTQRSRLSSAASNNRRVKTSDGGRLTKTLILITIFFIVFTAPAAIFYIFFGKTVKRHRDLITMSLSNLATTSHVTSFIIYWLTSSDFRTAAISVLLCKPVGQSRQSTEDKQRDKPVSDQQTLTRPSIVPTDEDGQRKLHLLHTSTTSQ
ncbi:unnamed protein product [Adineta ricciae]|nr:unnamed protein product [Adineta ricciae]